MGNVVRLKPAVVIESGIRFYKEKNDADWAAYAATMVSTEDEPIGRYQTVEVNWEVDTVAGYFFVAFCDIDGNIIGGLL